MFLDESAAKTNMTRLRGRCPRGDRLHFAYPHGHWRTTTMISSVRLDGSTASMVIDGACIWFLPPYSPDLNPIEKMWSKVKQALRSFEARSHEELLAAIAKALALVTASDVRHWFASCGYNFI